MPLEELSLPHNCSDEDEMRARFKISCRRCGSENIAVDMEQSYRYSEYTHGGGSLRMGCNDCKQNDFYASL